MVAETSPTGAECEVRSGDASLQATVSGEGAPLVMLHGWAMDQRVFRPQVDALASEFRVITFDRRGFGRTDGTPDLGREPEDIDAIADRLIGGPFHLLGLSQGGRVALRYAATRPERLRSVIVQGAAVDGIRPEGPDEERIPIEEYASLVRDGRVDEFRRRWLRHPMMQVGEDHWQAEALLRDMLADYEGRDLIAAQAVATDFPVDVPQALAESGLPLLILTGARETAARRRMAAHLREHVPAAREVVLPASGHLGNLSEPEAYNEAVRRFCHEADARRASAGSAPD